MEKIRYYLAEWAKFSNGERTVLSGALLVLMVTIQIAIVQPLLIPILIAVATVFVVNGLNYLDE